MRKLIVAVGLLSICGSLLADDSGWSGKGELGFVSTSGNTDTSTLNAGLEFVREMDQWRHRFALDALKAEDNNNDTANRYGLEWQSDYKLTDVSYVFGVLRYDNDDFAPYSEAKSAVVGYGRQLIDNEVNKLKGEIGIGYRELTDALTDLDSTDAIVRGLLDYARVISENTTFTNVFLVEAGSDNTFIENDTALNVAINDKFALKLGFLVRHNTDVSGNLDDTDTLTSANLVYNFK